MDCATLPSKFEYAWTIYQRFAIHPLLAAEPEHETDDLLQDEVRDQKERARDDDHHEHHGGGDERLLARRPGDLLALGPNLSEEFERTRSRLRHRSIPATRTRGLRLRRHVRPYRVAHTKTARKPSGSPRHPPCDELEMRCLSAKSSRCRPAGISWQEWRDSNPQPPVLETGALTS